MLCRILSEGDVTRAVVFSEAKAACIWYSSAEERNTGALTRMFAEQLMFFLVRRYPRPKSYTGKPQRKWRGPR